MEQTMYSLALVCAHTVLIIKYGMHNYCEYRPALLMYPVELSYSTEGVMYVC